MADIRVQPSGGLTFHKTPQEREEKRMRQQLKEDVKEINQLKETLKEMIKEVDELLIKLKK